MWHRHVWGEAERFVSPPFESGNFKGTGATVMEMMEACRAKTTILYRCECGEMKTIVITGEGA